MKKINIAKALKGKGMYIAIASCAVVISGAGIIAYNMAIDDINTDITYTPPATSQNITKNPDSNINEQAGISIEIGDEISKLAGIPVVMTTVMEDLKAALDGKIKNLFALKLQKKLKEML